MYNIIINIIAWIAIIWFVSLMFWHIAIYCWNRLDCGCKYVTIKRTTYFMHNCDTNFILLPSIDISILSKYKSIEFSWFVWSFSICYHIMTEKEEDLEAQIRYKLEKDEK